MKAWSIPTWAVPTWQFDFWITIFLLRLILRAAAIPNLKKINLGGFIHLLLKKKTNEIKSVFITSTFNTPKIKIFKIRPVMNISFKKKSKFIHRKKNPLNLKVKKVIMTP